MASVVLRELWRRRVILAVGIAIAFVAATLMSYSVKPGFPPRLESRQYDSGFASIKVLVDTPRSQAVDVGPDTDSEGLARNLPGLSTRAHLLASLMAASPLRDRIAAAADISRERFLAIPPAGDAPASAGAPNTYGVDPDDRETVTLRVLINETLPIITINANAPDAATARRAATAAVRELRAYLESVAAAGSVPEAQELDLTPVSTASAGTIRKGPQPVLALAAFMLLGLLSCAVTVTLPGLSRGWRQLRHA
jgi:hypothetical protein